MRNRGAYIYKLIYTTSIVLFLFSLFIRTIDFKTKIILIPFIICGFASIGKNICLMLDKKKYVNIFSKMFIISFLIFWFGFLIFWGYLCIKGKNYLTILFEIPFLIAGIYMVRKFLFGIKPKDGSNNKKSRFDFKVIVSSFLVLSVLIIGLSCLFFGIRDTYRSNKITREYVTTEGYFTDYKIYNTSKKDGTTYKPIYTYKVDEKEYTVATDYGVGYIPETNSTRKVKYNPNNHSEAVLVGTSGNNFLIYFGAFFTLGGSVFVLAALYIKGVFDKVKIDVMGTYVGFIILIVGIGIILFQNQTTSSLIKTIKSMGFWFIIPSLFIIVGVFQIIKCLFLSLNNHKKQ